MIIDGDVISPNGTMTRNNFALARHSGAVLRDSMNGRELPPHLGPIAQRLKGKRDRGPDRNPIASLPLA